jgi:hypothetical protein
LCAMNQEKFSFALFIVSGVFLGVLAVFALGFSIAYFRVWPYGPH